MSKPITTVVPKSGSERSSAATIPSTKRCGKMPAEKIRMRSCLRESERASHSTSASLTSSLGWNWTGPSESQRRAPPAARPSPGTWTSRSKTRAMRSSGVASVSSRR